MRVLGREFDAVLARHAGAAQWPRPALRFILLVLIALAALPAVRPAAAASDILVGLAPGASVDTVLSRAGVLAAPRSLGADGIYELTVGNQSQALAVLRGNPAVRYAEPDGEMALPAGVARQQAATSPDDHWGLERVDAAPAWSISDGGDITVAVLDTGVSSTHPELAGRVLPGFDFIHNQTGADDDAGHGTFVAGIIAAARQPDGTSGVAPRATILPVKILDQNGVGSTANFVAGINYAVTQGARVINISAGGIDDSQALEDALNNAEAHGVVVVAAAGNDGIDALSYPAAVPTVLAVSASDQNDAVPGFATYGPYVDLAAPGVDIASTWWSASGGNGRMVASGTSASAPFVSGAAALLLSAHPQLSPSRVREDLEEAAVDIDQPGIDAHSGFGRLDVAGALRLASSSALAGTLSLSNVDGKSHLIFTAPGFQPNEPVTVLLHDDLGGHSLGGFHADAAGQLSADLGPTTSFPSEAPSATAVGESSGVVARGSLSLGSKPASDAFSRVAPVTSTSDVSYFPETGHTLSGEFKTYWQNNGGLAVFGYPISEPFQENGITVQYFERNRFEYHPELAGTPYDVSLGRLGSQIAPQAYPTAPPPAVSDPNTLYFPETGHSLSGAFLAYWQQHGGLAVFGYPISEPFEQNGHLVQYFERNRFELHPENAGTPYLVLLARFGVDLAYEQGYIR